MEVLNLSGEKTIIACLIFMFILMIVIIFMAFYSIKKEKTLKKMEFMLKLKY
jgi:hypothetical protein